MKVRAFVPVLLLTLFLSLSCAKEHEVKPYIEEFVNAYTDEGGSLSLIRNDAGVQYYVYDTLHLQADTCYRMVVSYVVNEDLFTATILDHADVLSSPARKADKNDIFSDPVNVRSAWLGGGWLNLIVEIRGLKKGHKLYAVEKSDSTEVAFSLFHDADKDISSYTLKVPMSIPMDKYAETLSRNGTITLTYTDFKGGTVTRTIQKESNTD